MFLDYRWVQTECRKLGDTDNPEVGELLKTAVRCLKERPVLFKYCAEEVMLYGLHKLKHNMSIIFSSNLSDGPHAYHTGSKYEA